MTKTTESTAIVPQNTAVAVPDWLRNQKPEGIEAVGAYQNLARLKVVQAQSDEELQDELGLGSLVIVPDRVLVATFEQPVKATPIFFWPSWALWRDANDQSGPPVVEETTDPSSKIALRAKSAQARVEPYPDNPGMKFTYREQLNFLFRIHEGEAAGMLAVHAFSSGGHAEGARLCGYLKRKAVPIYANVIELIAGKKTNKQKKSWYQLDTRPAQNPFCSEADFEPMRALHLDAKAAFDSQTFGLADEDPAPTYEDAEE